MSSGTNAMDSEHVAEIQNALIESYFAIAPATLLLYDTALTFGQDIELVWKRQRLGITFLFTINRVVGIISALSMIFCVQSPSCLGIMIFSLVAQLLPFLVWAAFSALRAYAVSGLAWKVAAAVFLLSLVPFVTNMYIFSTSRFSFSSTTCADITTLSHSVLIITEYIARVSVIFSDAIVLFVTWRRTYNIRKHANAANIKASLATLLLRDGTLYFVAGLAFNAVQLGIYFKYTTHGGIDFSPWVTSACYIISSRFILSLRQLSQEELSNRTISSLLSGTLQFAPRIVSNMGVDIDVTLTLFSQGYEEGPTEVSSGEVDAFVLDDAVLSVGPIVEEIRQV